MKNKKKLVELFAFHCFLTPEPNSNEKPLVFGSHGPASWQGVDQGSQKEKNKLEKL